MTQYSARSRRNRPMNPSNPNYDQAYQTSGGVWTTTIYPPPSYDHINDFQAAHAHMNMPPPYDSTAFIKTKPNEPLPTSMQQTPPPPQQQQPQDGVPEFAPEQHEIDARNLQSIVNPNFTLDNEQLPAIVVTNSANGTITEPGVSNSRKLIA